MQIHESSFTRKPRNVGKHKLSFFTQKLRNLRKHKIQRDENGENPNQIDETDLEWKPDDWFNCLAVYIHGKQTNKEKSRRKKHP